jgi:predicted permease
MIMDRVRGLLKQLRVFGRRTEVDREMDEELAFHLDMEARSYVARGMSPEDARRAAMLAFNGVERTKELVREGRWTRFIEETVSDVLLAVRSLRRTTLFTTIAVLTLAVGIGANGALFALLNSVLYRAPGGIDATNVVWVDVRSPMRQISYPDFRDLRAAASRAVTLASYLDTSVGIAVGDGDATHATAHLVSANYFDVLRAKPQIGRGFHPEEEAIGGSSAVAVISDAMWRREFSASRSVVGRSVRINGHTFTVVGVAPRKFSGTELGQGADLWLPMGAQPLAMPRGYDVLGSRDHGEVHMIGRLANGIDGQLAQSLLRTAAGNLPRESSVKAATDGSEPSRARALRRPALDVYPMRGWVRGGTFGEMRVVLAASWILTGLLLLIVCANIANLLLSRSAVRQREFGVRAALGARRSRLVRLLTTEALVLSFAATGPALFIAIQGARMCERIFLTPLAPLHVTIDARMLLFSIASAALCAIIFGLTPALRFSRPDVVSILKGGLANGLRRTKAQRFFVVAQVSMSVVLLVASALFLRRVQDARNADIGFDPDHVVVATFDAYTRGLKPDQMQQLFERMSAATRRIPGVSAVSAPTFAPFKGGAMMMSAAAMERRADTTASVSAVGSGVSPGYFDVLGAHLLRGRYLQPSDEIAAAPRVAVVSEALAQRLWKSSNVIGRTLSLDGADEPTTVVGVVADMRDSDLSGPIQLRVYVPYNRSLHLAESHLLVRSSRDAASLMPDVRRAIHDVDPDLALFDMQTLRATIGENVAFVSRLAMVVGSFGIIAIFLAGIGLYGIVAFSVLGRTREIGVRVALGARPSRVVMDFVRQGVVLTLVGIVAGTGLALAFGRLLATMFEGLHSADPFAIGGVAITLILISVAASIVPALRAGRVDAMTSLRAE